MTIQNFEEVQKTKDRKSEHSKNIYTREEVIFILTEFLNFTSDSVPEQQGGYDIEKERWISGKEIIEDFFTELTESNIM